MEMEFKADETGTAVVPVLACVLDQLCLRNDQLAYTSKSSNKFHALVPPAISIRDYLSRIAKYACCSGECFVLALVYIDRIIQSNPSFVVNSLNIHRLLITSIMLAAKFFDDQYFNNAYYAKVGGVPCLEMNSLEVEFLFMANFTLFVTTAKYSQYYSELCNHASHSNCGCSEIPVPGLIIPPLRHKKQLITPDKWNDKRTYMGRGIQAETPNAHYLPPFTFHLQESDDNDDDGNSPLVYGQESARMSMTADAAPLLGQEFGGNSNDSPMRNSKEAKGFSQQQSQQNTQQRNGNFQNIGSGDQYNYFHTYPQQFQPSPDYPKSGLSQAFNKTHPSEKQNNKQKRRVDFDPSPNPRMATSEHSLR